MSHFVSTIDSRGHSFKERDMSNMLGTLFHSVLKLFNVDSLYSLRRSGFLNDVGWFKSFDTGMSIDSKGNPIPWITYSAINFLEKRIHKKMVVFEYSCGNSTLWWASRAKKLISCEHNKLWYEKMKQQIPQNVELSHIDLVYGGMYSNEVSKYNMMFDIIIIDGRDRINCVKKSLKAIKEDGVFIWDNSERASYKEGYDFLLLNGYKRLDFEGMGPINVVPWCTSIFYKQNNCLNI